MTADRFPDGAVYEQAYNLISDGAAACVVSRAARRRSGSWPPTRSPTAALGRASDDETVGTYFTYTHRAGHARRSARAGLRAGDIDWVVPQNTNDKAWQILARLSGVDHERVWFPTLPDVGHVISADNIVNLAALADVRPAAPGRAGAAGHGRLRAELAGRRSWRRPSGATMTRRRRRAATTAPRWRRRSSG